MRTLQRKIYKVSVKIGQKIFTTAAQGSSKLEAEQEAIAYYQKLFAANKPRVVKSELLQ